jgi:hypothetical protein
MIYLYHYLSTPLLDLFTKPPLEGLVFDQDKHTYVYFSLSKPSPSRGIKPKGLVIGLISEI